MTEFWGLHASRHASSSQAFESARSLGQLEAMGSEAEAEAGTARVPEAWAARITWAGARTARITGAFQVSSVATEASQGTIVALVAAWATEASQGTIVALVAALVVAWATEASPGIIMALVTAWAPEASQGTIVALDTAWATEASQGTIMASFEALVVAWATAPFAVASWEAIAFVAFAAPWEASAALWEAFDTALGAFPIA